MCQSDFVKNVPFRGQPHIISTALLLLMWREARKDVAPKSLNVSRFIWERKAF